MIIELPWKIYRLKVQNKYIPSDYGTEIDGCIFDYTHFRKSIFNPTIDWRDHKFTDMITYSEEIDLPELKKTPKINSNVTQEIRKRIISLIKQYWDFSKRGYRPTIIG